MCAYRRSLFAGLLVAVLTLGAWSRVAASDGGMSIVSMPTSDAMPTVIEVENAPEGPVLLENGSGVRVELTAPPEREGGVLVLRTPILFGGVHRLTVGSEVLEFEVPGWSPTAIATQFEGSARGGSAIFFVTAAGIVVCVVAAGWRLRGRRRVVLAVAGGLVAVGLAALGTLQVSESRSARGLALTLAACQEAGSEFSVERLSPLRDCIDAALGEYMAAEGVSASVVALAAAYPDGENPCHEAAHDLGRLAWLRDGDPATAELPDADLCRLGFVHGMLEAAALTLSSDTFADVTDDICKQLGLDGRPGVDLECVHGRGHSTMRRTGGDLHDAFALCALGRPTMAEICQLGAVMEWGNLRRAAGQGLAVHPSPVVDAFDLCTSGLVPMTIAADCFATGADFEYDSPTNAKHLLLRCPEDVPGEYVEACVRGVALQLLSGRISVDESLERCAKLPSEELAKVCARSVGVTLAPGHFNDVEAGKRRCGSESLAASCREGLETFVGQVQSGQVP